MADAPPERGRFYRFIHHSTKRYPFLPILRVHRHSLPPEGQDPPPLADLHPGDVVEVAPVHVLGPGDIHPETGAVVATTTEVPTAVNDPHLEPISSSEATETNIGAAMVQDPAKPETMVTPAPSPVPAEPAGFAVGGVVPSAPEPVTLSGETVTPAAEPTPAEVPAPVPEATPAEPAPTT